MSRSLLKQIIIVAVLLLLLILLAGAYMLLTAPPESEGAAGARDRQFLYSIYGFEGDLLRRPTGVDIDARGNVYVADTGKRRIVVFDRNRRFLRVYGEAGQGALLIYDPIDVAVTPDGRSWVVDRTQGKIVEYDVTGVAVREIATPEPPTQITISDDTMFVTVDSGVLIADLEGNLLTGYISRGKEPGQFDRPGGVAVGEDGTLYVADSLNYRVQAISTKGESLWQYGEPLPPGEAIQFGDESRKFGLPSNITIDDNGLLYVVDGVDSEIVVMDTDGNEIEVIGDVGSADGMFYYPDGIAYSNGRLVVADKFNDRVQVFRVPMPLGAQWRSFLPWALALALLPLLLLPLLARRRKHVVTPEFLSALERDEERDLVVDALKRVHATPALVTAGETLENVALKWKAHEFAEEDVATVLERFPIGREQAEALVVAAGLRGKRILVTDDELVRSAAESFTIPVVTYEELQQAARRESGEDASGQAAGSDDQGTTGGGASE